MDLLTFNKLSRNEVSKIVESEGRPKCVAIMLDGSRRILKLKPKYRNNTWLYGESHIRKLIYKSINTVDMLFEMGVKTVVGPLASFGNFHRDLFIPQGLKRLLDPLIEEYSLGVYNKHHCSVSFYGNTDYLKDNLKYGDIVNYIDKFKDISFQSLDRHLLIGLGFSTDYETEIIAHQAIKFYQKNKKIPTLSDLSLNYFGYSVDSIDIFIRTNEIRMSGGLTPLLTGHDTQLYFPIAPGIISFSERLIRSILYDYLFCRNKSHGTFQHREISNRDTNRIKAFYQHNKSRVFGLGRRVGDIWLPKV